MTAPLRCFVATFAVAITVVLSGCGNKPKTTAGDQVFKKIKRGCTVSQPTERMQLSKVAIPPPRSPIKTVLKWVFP
jgi:hypothetical protein